MGNTPKPCDSYNNLYTDCFQYENPDYDSECMKRLSMGNLKCKKYTLHHLLRKKYTKFPQQTYVRYAT